MACNGQRRMTMVIKKVLEKEGNHQNLRVKQKQVDRKGVGRIGGG